MQVILCRLQDKGRRKIEVIVEEMKEWNRGERKMNDSVESEEIKTFPPPLCPYRLQWNQVLPNCKSISGGRPDDVRYTTPLLQRLWSASLNSLDVVEGTHRISENWSDCADKQADLRLRSSHNAYCSCFVFSFFFFFCFFFFFFFVFFFFFFVFVCFLFVCLFFFCFFLFFALAQFCNLKYGHEWKLCLYK